MTNAVAAKRVLTELQKSFLDHLATDANGNPVEAKKLAGYSDNTSVTEIVDALRDEIKDLARAVLERSAVKASLGLVGVIDDPSTMGAANRIKAATEVLDRIGMVKQEQAPNNIPQGTIFILPPKNAKSITVDYDDIETIDVTPDD